MGHGLDSFLTAQGGLPAPGRRATSSTALLDQLPRVGRTVRRQPLADLLRPAYRAPGEP